jgi:hypothetical protein
VLDARSVHSWRASRDPIQRTPVSLLPGTNVG